MTFTANTSKGFDVESGTPTGTSLEILGKSYELFATSKGSTFIKLTNAKGTYPLWIGADYGSEQVTVNGKSFPVGQTSKGSNFVLQLSKSGLPYAMYLGTKTAESFEGQTVYQTKSGSYFIFADNGKGGLKQTYLTAN